MVLLHRNDNSNKWTLVNHILSPEQLVPRQLHQWWCHSNVSQNASPMSHRSIGVLKQCRYLVVPDEETWLNTRESGKIWCFFWTKNNHQVCKDIMKTDAAQKICFFQASYWSTHGWTGSLGTSAVEPWQHSEIVTHVCCRFFFLGVSMGCFWIQAGYMLGYRGYDMILYFSDDFDMEISETLSRLGPRGCLALWSLELPGMNELRLQKQVSDQEDHVTLARNRLGDIC